MTLQGPSEMMAEGRYFASNNNYYNINNNYSYPPSLPQHFQNILSTIYTYKYMYMYMCLFQSTCTCRCWL